MLTTGAEKDDGEETGVGMVRIPGLENPEGDEGHTYSNPIKACFHNMEYNS